MEYGFKSAISKVFTFCCLLLMVSWIAFAQEPEELVIPGEYPGMAVISEETMNQDLKDERDMSDLNRITIQQMGKMNEAFIQQYSGGDPNLVKVYQDGDDHYSELIQTGIKNATDITQFGTGNSYSGFHIGNYIVNTVIQKGIGNVITQDLKADNLDFQIEQSGIGHGLFQTETRDGIGYKVTQKGDVGMKITIIQDNIYK